MFHLLTRLAQDAPSAPNPILMAVGGLFYLALIVLMIASTWRLFTRAVLFAPVMFPVLAFGNARYIGPGGPSRGAFST